MCKPQELILEHTCGSNLRLTTPGARILHQILYCNDHSLEFMAGAFYAVHLFDLRVHGAAECTADGGAAGAEAAHVSPRPSLTAPARILLAPHVPLPVAACAPSAQHHPRYGPCTVLFDSRRGSCASLITGLALSLCAGQWGQMCRASQTCDGGVGHDGCRGSTRNLCSLSSRNTRETAPDVPVTDTMMILAVRVVLIMLYFCSQSAQPWSAVAALLGTSVFRLHVHRHINSKAWMLSVEVNLGRLHVSWLTTTHMPVGVQHPVATCMLAAIRPVFVENFYFSENDCTHISLLGAERTICDCLQKYLPDTLAVRLCSSFCHSFRVLIVRHITCHNNNDNNNNIFMISTFTCKLKVQ